MLALPVNNPCLILHKFCIRQPLRCSSTTQCIRINSLLNYTCTLCKLEVSSYTCQQATTSASNRRNSPAVTGHGYVPFSTPAYAFSPIPSTLHQKPVAALSPHNRELTHPEHSTTLRGSHRPRNGGFSFVFAKKIYFFGIEGRIGDCV